MSDNHKYYYIKLKDNYFDQDNIKVLESMKNGYIYSLVLIKMYLRASKYDGRLMMTQTIPYEPNNLEILASVLGHDIDHVKEAIRVGTQLDLITIIDGKEIWLTEIQNFIGQSSTEADRIRKYRAKIAQTETFEIAEKVDSVQMYDKSTPEIELETKLKINRDNKINYQNIIDFFNENCLSSPKVVKLNDKRRKAIKAVVSEYGEQEVKDALLKVENSPFLSGKDGRWRASFDWLMNKNNLLKVIEGNYDHKKKLKEGDKGYYANDIPW